MPRHLRIGVLLALAAALAGCGSKKTVVDPSYTYPEGLPSSELELVTFPETPNVKYRLVDRGRIGQVDLARSVNDTVGVDTLDVNAARVPITQAYYPQGPGHVSGVIFNRTGADGMEIYRTEPNGAVRKIFRFTLQPQRRFIDRRTEIYLFTDPDPPTAGATYFARGVLGGVGSAQSPISNASHPTLGAGFANIQYTANRDGTLPVAGGGVPPPAESTFIMRWTPVAGTTKYWIQVFEYQPRAFTLTDRILSGSPTPLVTDLARDIFIGSVPAGTTQYKLGDPGATIFTFRAPRLRAEYFIRISAIGSSGQMIGMTTGPTLSTNADLRQIQDPRDWFSDFTSAEVSGATPPAFLYYSRGAVRVSPGEIASSPQAAPQ